MPLGLETKSRSFPPIRSEAKLEVTTYFPNDPPYRRTFFSEEVAEDLRGRQITASENHPGWYDASPINGDIGGPFSMERKEARVIGTAETSISGFTVDDVGVKSNSARYQGTYLAINPRDPQVQFPSLQGRSNSSLEAMGTKAIALAKPTNSVANLATALIELYREGLPKLAGSMLLRDKFISAKDPKLGNKVAKEYLNKEFGLDPLIGDLIDTYKAIKTADAVMRQYERDAGKVVRRKFEFPSESTRESKTIDHFAVPYVPRYNSNMTSINPGARGKLIQDDVYERRMWFSGAFTYHLPSDWYKQGSSGKLDRLLGTDVTPSVIWDVTPWSWFADWFANTGDVISNLTDMATDGLVLRYGYIMEHERASRTFTYTGPSPFNGAGPPASLELVVETKKRLRATPYGFGITWDGFSPRQLAILAALGITKGSKR